MSHQTIFENDYATLWYHPEKKIVHHQFHKYIYGAEFREILNKGIEAMEQYGAQKWLSDDRNNSSLTKDDTDWSLTDWTPRVMKAGWKYWAIVLPKKVVGQVTMKRFADMYNEKGITVRLFSEPDEALAWLESV